MFKKTKIAAATIALLGAAAAQNVSAVALDETGTKSQVLIFPYYNVNNGFQSQFNLRNTTDKYKAVKLRFRESKASNDVLDFNVYMSPYDHFSVTVSKNSAGNASLTTADTTCTYPALYSVDPQTGLYTFKNVEFKGSVYTNTTAVDAREGYVEVFELGELDTVGLQSGSGYPANWPLHKSLPIAVANANGNKFTFAPFQGSAGTYASTCGGAKGNLGQGGAVKVASATLSDAGNGGDKYVVGTSQDSTGYHAAASPIGLTKPTGGIQGYSILLGVTDGAAFVGDAVAIRNYQTAVAQHYWPDDENYYLLPSLASGNVVTTTGLNNNATANTTNTWNTVVYDWGLSDPNLAPNKNVYTGLNPMPVSDVLAASGLTNDYFINPAFGAATDWVVTFPMRKHGIFNNYRYDNLDKNTATHPVDKFVSTTGDVGFQYTVYDREEQKANASDAAFSPAVQGNNTFDREVNVLVFESATNPSKAVLGTDPGAVKKITLDSKYKEGWTSLSFTSATNLLSTYKPVSTPWISGTPDVGVNSAKGIPAIGFAAIRGNFSGATTDNVGETVPHVFIKSR